MQKLLLSLIGVLFALGLSEVGLRLFAPQATGPIQFAIDPQRGMIPVPNQHAIRTVPGVYKYSYTNNSLGLRGSKEYGPKIKRRILLLGDSFTYGLGVNDNETFSAVLQDRLPEYEIINAGNPGSGTDYALEVFDVLNCHPDLVFLTFCPNDFSDNQRQQFFDSDFRPKPITIKKPWITQLPFYPLLIEHSHLANLLKTFHTNHLSETVPTDRNEVLTKRYLDKLRERVNNQGAKFIVFYVPAREELSQPSENQMALKRLIEVHDFAGLSYSDYIEGDGHWNAHGHQIAAENFWRVVQSR